MYYLLGSKTNSRYINKHIPILYVYTCRITNNPDYEENAYTMTSCIYMALISVYSSDWSLCLGVLIASLSHTQLSFILSSVSQFIVPKHLRVLSSVHYDWIREKQQPPPCAPYLACTQKCVCEAIGRLWMSAI